MKTANDIKEYIKNEWCGYVLNLIGRYGISVSVSELTNTERTVIEMYSISINCFM